MRVFEKEAFKGRKRTKRTDISYNNSNVYFKSQLTCTKWWMIPYLKTVAIRILCLRAKSRPRIWKKISNFRFLISDLDQLVEAFLLELSLNLLKSFLLQRSQCLRMLELQDKSRDAFASSVREPMFIFIHWWWLSLLRLHAPFKKVKFLENFDAWKKIFIS